MNEREKREAETRETSDKRNSQTQRKCHGGCHPSGGSMLMMLFWRKM